MSEMLYQARAVELLIDAYVIGETSEIERQLFEELKTTEFVIEATEIMIIQSPPEQSPEKSTQIPYRMTG